MGKPAGIVLVPLMTVALVAMLLFLPRIDPLRKNYAAFRDWYDGFIPAFVLFMPAGPVPGHPPEPWASHRHELLPQGAGKILKRSAVFFRVIYCWHGTRGGLPESG